LTTNNTRATYNEKARFLGLEGGIGGFAKGETK